MLGLKRKKCASGALWLDAAQSQLTTIPRAFAKDLCSRLTTQRNDSNAAWRRHFFAWLVGGLGAADAFLRFAELRDLLNSNQGKQDEATRLRGFVRVFTLAMVSRWCHYRWRTRMDVTDDFLWQTGFDVFVFFAEAALPEPARDTRSIVSSLASDHVVRSALDEFVAIHRQFEAEAEAAEAGHGVGGDTYLLPMEPDLVASVAARELGRPLPLPIGGLGLPESSLNLLVSGWRPLLGLGDILAAVGYFNAWATFMFDVYDGTGELEK